MPEVQRVDRLREKDLPEFEPDVMVKLLATIGPGDDGVPRPNLALIALMRAKSVHQIFFGAFIKGKTKDNLDREPRCGVAFMNLKLNYWVMKGNFSHWAYEGEDYEFWNEVPLLRYNAYSGVEKVGYVDLVEVSPRRRLPLGGLLRGILACRLARGALKTRLPPHCNRMSPRMTKFFQGALNPKFLAWVGEDGYPEVVPVVQLQAVDANRLAFPPTVFPRDLARVPVGAWVAVLCVDPKEMLLFQVKGTFQGFRRARGVKLGVVDVEEVYSSMPPKPGDRLYPPPEPRDAPGESIGLV
ncbi:MAG: hypothetical protein Kow0069_10090 [Promethearchaeota archaeon]